MDYKEETRHAYNTFPDTFDNKFETYLQQSGEKINKFLKRLPSNSKILDAGSGAGNHAVHFQQAGHNVICIDISEEMIKLCRKKALSAQIMDFEHLKFSPESFDGVFAYTSLLHVPKEKIRDILEQISRVLKPSGIFFLGMKKGNNEGFRVQDKYPGIKRWFSLYTDKELRTYLVPLFHIESYFEITRDEQHSYMNYILKKKF